MTDMQYLKIEAEGARVLEWGILSKEKVWYKLHIDLGITKYLTNNPRMTTKMIRNTLFATGRVSDGKHYYFFQPLQIGSTHGYRVNHSRRPLKTMNEIFADMKDIFGDTEEEEEGDEEEGEEEEEGDEEEGSGDDGEEEDSGNEEEGDEEEEEEEEEEDSGNEEEGDEEEEEEEAEEEEEEDSGNDEEEDSGNDEEEKEDLDT
jgi:hypothetical protein